jgi:purine-binding chemotaxis protein CheW
MAPRSDADPPAGDPPEAAAERAPGRPARRAPARKAAAGRSPSARARVKKAALEPPAELRAVVFTLGGDEYALPVEQVREVIAFREPRDVASGVSWVRGVINLRGTIVPVCDLAARLGRDARPAASAKIVVVEADGGPAGLIVDSVREVLTVAGEHLDRGTFTDDPAVTAIAKLDDRLVVVLDAPAALAGAGLDRR